MPFTRGAEKSGKGFAAFRKRLHPEILHLKIGLSTGDPVTEKNLIFEKAVKLAERMTRIIREELIVSAEVRELYNNENQEPLLNGRWSFPAHHRRGGLDDPTDGLH